MSRRHRAEKRETIPDIRYSSPLVAHLINVIMERGKKSLAQRIVYGAFERVSEKLGKGDPVDLMIGALENARPRLEVRAAGWAAPPTKCRWKSPTNARRVLRCGGL
jgi:small subunit ribosomal protein S7